MLKDSTVFSIFQFAGYSSRDFQIYRFAASKLDLETYEDRIRDYMAYKL